MNDTISFAARWFDPKVSGHRRSANAPAKGIVARSSTLAFPQHISAAIRPLLLSGARPCFPGRAGRRGFVRKGMSADLCADLDRAQDRTSRVIELMNHALYTLVR